jgi:predicted dehydrogenase
MIGEIWLIGSGAMAFEYVKVLQALGANIKVIGRSKESSNSFTRNSGVAVIEGGLINFLNKKPKLPEYAIVCVGVEGLAELAKKLIESGIKNILIEKPGALTEAQIRDLSDVARLKSAKVFIGYNRRFYSATQKALQIINNDGGLKSIHFEFTEWGGEIRNLKKGNGVKEFWFLANSTHVVDLAFYIAGLPVEMKAFTYGSLDWHTSSAIFAGAGVTNKNVIFSYQANWEAPGRWGLELLTANNRLIFRPMETLQVMKTGSLRIEDVELEDDLDKKFKPGLYVMVRKFLAGKNEDLCTLEHQQKAWKTYCTIAGYD